MSEKTFSDGAIALHWSDFREALKGIKDGSVAMIWTDPPYGHANHDGDLNARLNNHRGLDNKPIANDTADGMRVVVSDMLDEAARILAKDCCCCCCCCGGGPKPTFAWIAERMDRLGMSFFHSVIWDKNNPGLGWRYRRQHEMVMVAHRAGGKLAWNEEYPAQPNIIKISKPRDGNHPNEKPVELVEWFILHHTQPGDTVVDPFMGSGTTALACIRTGRRFIGSEIDPAHYLTAVDRVTRELAQGQLFACDNLKRAEASTDDLFSAAERECA